jgi:hypothetical protein
MRNDAAIRLSDSNGETDRKWAIADKSSQA